MGWYIGKATEWSRWEGLIVERLRRDVTRSAYTPRATAKRVIDRSRRLFDLADGLAKRKYHAARAPC